MRQGNSLMSNNFIFQFLRYDSMICVAGGFDMGSVKDKEVFEKYQKLDKMNLQSALLTSHLATRYLS